MKKGMKKRINKGVIIAAIVLFVFIVLAILTCLGFRVKYDPNLGINWQATAAVGTIFGAFVTVAVGVIAINIAKQANDLVKKQDEIARKERLLREVEKTVQDVNYILSLRFVHASIKDARTTKDYNANMYSAEIMICLNSLEERMIDFHQKGVINLEFIYYDYAFSKIKEVYDVLSKVKSLDEGLKALEKLGFFDPTNHIKFGMAYIAHAEKNLFGEDRLYKHSAKWDEFIEEYKNAQKGELQK